MCPCGFDIPEACLVRLGLDGGFRGTGIDPGFLRVGRDPSGFRFHRIHPLFDPRFSSFRSWVRSGETTGRDSFLSRPVRPPPTSPIDLQLRRVRTVRSFPFPLSNVPFRFGFDTCGAGGGSSPPTPLSTPTHPGEREIDPPFCRTRGVGILHPIRVGAFDGEDDGCIHTCALAPTTRNMLGHEGKDGRTYDGLERRKEPGRRKERETRHGRTCWE